MNMLNKIGFALAALMLSSCSLLDPGDVENPNVSEGDFLNSSNAMETWVNGANRNFAIAIGRYAELMEILSDNYFNTYTAGSKVFDNPTLLYTDSDVTALQRYVGSIRESAEYGLEKVAPADAETTNEQRFNLLYLKGYSYLLAGEYFIGLPTDDGGDVVPWKDNLGLAISVFNEALTLAETSTDKAFINTLIARAYYRLGDKENSVKYSDAALSASEDFTWMVEFDGENGLFSGIQEFLSGTYGTAYQPLPRLDFLDPKYFKKTDLDARPICIAKAEEPYLIKAEAAAADGSLSEAKSILMDLLDLVALRPVETDVNDQVDGDFAGGSKAYPEGSDYVVASSPGEAFRSGLVLDRKSPNLISVPYISGTSVTSEIISSASTEDELLELIYLMRQEIFIAEGRRAADLGIRLPLCDVEAANASNGSEYTQAQIPSFIPLNGGMDDFTMDENARTVVIAYDMNKIIVENKTSDYVAPFN
jgi:tetratricopeptide (TPR) repeat protein